MAKSKKSTVSKKKKPIEQYDHKDKQRANNPPVGLVTPDTDKDLGKKTYQYDPHLDPQLQWAGKAERLSFDVDTVSLHVHERIDPRSIIEAVRKQNGSDYEQMSLFNSQEENPPLRDAIEFYKHSHNWSNRLIAGDSLLVMNSLIEKEGLAGQVQMIYIDPPYGINYGSNFQPFVNKKVVKDKDEDLAVEPEIVKAFRDTWQLGIHSYLSYFKDRILLARELLHSSGSIFIQISDENFHYIRNIMDEVFGVSNFICDIRYRTRTIPLSTNLLDISYDHLIWYCKDKTQIKFRKLFFPQKAEGDQNFRFVEFTDGTRRPLTKEEHLNHYLLQENSKVFAAIRLRPTQYRKNQDFNFKFNGKLYAPPGGNVKNTPDGINSWSTTQDGMKLLGGSNRLIDLDGELKYVLYYDDYPVTPYGSIWNDTAAEKSKIYVVQTTAELPKRCLIMTTDPGDLVIDPTSGSGTTAFAAEQWGRRWITCDTSRVSITLAKQRLMTGLFDYYELAHPDEGVDSGFKYDTVPHITLGSIANNEPPATEILYDRPLIDKSKHRVTGPFTVEAVPSLAVRSIDEVQEGAGSEIQVDSSIVRSGETLRQSEWREELFRTGIRGRNKQYVNFTRVEPLSGTKWLHADAETLPEAKSKNLFEKDKQLTFDDKPQRVVISFGPEHSPLEQRQVALAVEEAQTLVPKPKMIVFASFQFDPEAAKDIDELNWPGVTLIKVQMNTDLLTDDLKKKRSSNESFWLIGSPDVKLIKVKSKKKDDPQLYQVEVLGFDYFNTKTGIIESGGKDKIAMWMLDTDYDGRSLFPRQVFFPMAGEKDGWSRLAKNLKAEIDEELIEAYRGSVSLPFEAGENQRIAVKIVDDRGIESLKIVEL